MERLDKLLSSTGRWSRKEAEQLIRSGRVTVDGVVAARREEKYPRRCRHHRGRGSHFRRGIYLSHAE